MPRQEVLSDLNISHCTLWRWQTLGFLKPIVGCRGRTAFFLRTEVEEFKADPKFRELTRIGRPPKTAAVK
jgi:hypothetical protein